MANYFINPKTGRKCKVGGPTHVKLMKQGGKGLPSMLAGLLLKEVGIPLAKKGIAAYKKRKHKGKGKQMMMAGTGHKGYGLSLPGAGLKLAGAGKRRKKKKTYHPKKFAFE